MFRKKKFAESIEFLESVIDCFQNMKVGNGTFKPFQRGVVIATKTAIELSTFLIEQRGYMYVLTARLNTDLVENLFSSVRAKQPIPNALQFKQNLKIITISKYMKSVNSSSYNEDDGFVIGDFFEKPKPKKEKGFVPDIPDIASNDVTIFHVEMYVIYNIAGYILSRIKKYNVHCTICLDSAGSKTEYPRTKYAKFVKKRCFKDETLFFVNDETFNFPTNGDRFQAIHFVFRS